MTRSRSRSRQSSLSGSGAGAAPKHSGSTPQPCVKHNHILLWNIIADLDSSFSYVWEWHEIIRSSENREQSWSEFSCQIWIKWNNNQACLKHLKGTKDDTHTNTAHTFKSLLEWFAKLENRFPVPGANLAKLRTCLTPRLEYLQLLLQDHLKDIVLQL